MKIGQISKLQQKPILKSLLLAGVLATAPLITGNAQNRQSNDNTYFTNTTSAPNIPIINDDYIYYRDLDGNNKKIDLRIFNFMAEKRIVCSLYKAIQKTSNQMNPDITDIGRFYTEVDKNIPMVHDERYKNVFIKFNKLFNLFTDPESDKGRTITVNEYTCMMDAWSSLSLRE